MTDRELLEQADKALGEVEKAIRKFTEASSLHQVSRSTIAADRNQLAGDVYEARKKLDNILSQSRSNIAEAIGQTSEKPTDVLEPWTVQNCECTKTCEKCDGHGWVYSNSDTGQTVSEMMLSAMERHG